MSTERSSALSPEYALLGLLRLAPGHGYDIHQRLTRELGAVWTVHQNQVYNILNRLQAAGYIRGDAAPAAGAHARRKLRLTAAGRRRFEAWLRAPTGPSVRALRVDFLTRLYFARRLDPGLAREILERQIDVTRQSLDRLRHPPASHQGTDPLAAYSADLRLRQLELALEWLRDLRRGPAGAQRAPRPMRAAMQSPRRRLSM
jgi:PadR family transcriptional regulator AphA